MIITIIHADDYDYYIDNPAPIGLFAPHYCVDFNRIVTLVTRTNNICGIIDSTTQTNAERLISRHLSAGITKLILTTPIAVEAVDMLPGNVRSKLEILQETIDGITFTGVGTDGNKYKHQTPEGHIYDCAYWRHPVRS